MTLTPSHSQLKLFSTSNFTHGNEHTFNLIWLLIFSLLLILSGLGLRDPWPADETRFAQVAKEMVESGQWFFPMRGGELYPDKPPVFMWSIAFFYWLTGSIRIAFLLPSALCSVLSVFLVYDLGRRLWNNQVGWYAFLVLLLSLEFMEQAKTAQIDAMVSCWITVSCYGLLRFILLGGGWRWYFLAWFFMGIGVITKGVGFLPLLMLLPYAALRFFKVTDLGITAKEIVGGWRWLAGPIVMLGAISLWLVPMLYLVDQYQDPIFNAYRDNILLRQTVTRYFDSWRHIKPFWYYLTSVIPISWLPISLILPWLVIHWKKAVIHADRRIILPLVWVILVLVFFSLTPGKRGEYILPALPMMALITAPYLLPVLSSKWFNRLILAIVITLSLLLLLFGITGILGLSVTAEVATRYQIEPWNFSLTLGTIGAAIAVFNFKRHRFASWIMFMPAFWIMFSTWGYTMLNPSKTPLNVFQQVARIIPDHAELALVDYAVQYIFFSPYPITHFGYRTRTTEEIKAAWSWLKKTPNGFILLDKKTRTSCFDMDKATPVGSVQRKNLVLLSRDNLLETCSAPTGPIIEYHYQRPALRSIVEN
jgi:4-amino-4-deoxy-L-arabinose transferase-like glycosyltransferase